MKPLPPIFSFVPSSRRYSSTTSRSGCTNESKLKTKSTEESGIIDRERPSFRQQWTCETLAQSAADTLRYIRSTYQRPITRCSSPSDNASTARTRAQFLKLFPPVNTRESSEKLCPPIARQSYPKVATILRPPLSSRTSFVEWLGAESNRRHVDFQSTALPTELPSRESRRVAWRGGIFTMQQSDCRASAALAAGQTAALRAPWPIL